MRREIVGDVGAVLRERLSADAWGRALVEVVEAPDGRIVVSGIDVEEVIGDEARIDELFGGDAVREVLPVLAGAVEALCAIDGVDVDAVGGGTFVRLPEGDFAWLPGLVHAPSRRLDAERDELLARLRAKNDGLAARFGFPGNGRVDVDLASETLSFASPGRPSLRARATLIGTFSPDARSWGWGGSNPHAPEEIRRASAALVDEILDRDMWELTTSTFATDHPTAWSLSALVCDRARGDGVYCGGQGGGMVFVLLRAVSEAGS